jgi:hypothetical protein
VRLKLDRLLAFTFIATACSADGTCVVPPCALSIAVTVIVTSASVSQPLPAGVFLTFTLNGTSGNGFCSSRDQTAICELPGSGGTYQIAIGAPGFQTQSRTANVTAPSPQKCGCALAETQHFEIALAPGT